MRVSPSQGRMSPLWMRSDVILTPTDILTACLQASPLSWRNRLRVAEQSNVPAAMCGVSIRFCIGSRAPARAMGGREVTARKCIRRARRRRDARSATRQAAQFHPQSRPRRNARRSRHAFIVAKNDVLMVCSVSGKSGRSEQTKSLRASRSPCVA